jgi:integrase
MSRHDFTRLDRPAKPDKPHPDFPLFAHANGCWAKKICGRLVYFGSWDSPDEALAKYLSEKDDLLAGRTPREPTGALTVGNLAGRFLTSRQRLLDSGELSPLSFNEYADCCRRIIEAFGKRRLVSDLRPADFESLRATFAKRWGPARLAKFIGLVRTLFNHAAKNGLIDRPVLFGDGFRRPSQKTFLLHKHARGPRLFEAHEVCAMLTAATPVLRSMILLGVNCGFGNADVGRLPLAVVNLETGWVNYPRPKTGIGRRCPLWPETVTAIRDWLAVRPEPRDPADAGLLFVTSKRARWASETTTASVLSAEMRKLLDRLGIDGNRNFYSLRHSFQTVADESGDFIAVRSIMGHGFSGDISAVYRERISDARLRKVVGVVHSWLFAE